MTRAHEPPELVRAAQELEDELSKLEALSRSVSKIRLHNAKSISRAAQELSEALHQPERIAGGLKLLGSAMARMQERQQAALEPLAARALEIQERAGKLSDYARRFEALGTEANQAKELLQSASPGEDNRAVIAEVEARLTIITGAARALAEAAHSDDLPDIARDADAFRQSMGALRGRLSGKGSGSSPEGN